jgi:adenine phosphoribosyltransferase
MDTEYIRSHIRTIPDFPETGIQFKDITPLLLDAKANELTLSALHTAFHTLSVDKVVGLESRGFLFGPSLAASFQAGFVPARKKGKLPYKTIQKEYGLEYGKDILEMHTDAINPGDNVIIHDDLLATGGTAKAATELVLELGGQVVGYSFIIELSFLLGKNQLLKDIPIRSIIQY